MESLKQNANYYQANKRFLTRSYTSREEFIKQYKKIYCDKIKAKLLYLQILSELKKSVLESSSANFVRLVVFLKYINDAENCHDHVYYYEDDANTLKNTNLIILACQYNNTEIVKCLFNNYSTILNELFFNRKTTILPDDKDETYHTAFYYAIRSSNVEVLATLIDKWPGNYFLSNYEKLEEILSRTYEELKLKNVLLSKEVEIFIEDMLINLRFFSSGSNKAINYKNFLYNINKRIELVLKQIYFLHTIPEVDETFLFIAKFIAQNIFILKQQLKSTYDRLPWEEIEFCLVSFVSSYIKKREINLFYQATLSRTKILKHLSDFANKLESERDGIQSSNVYKLVTFPNISRNVNISKIINNNPAFEELYNDYQEIRDIHSLEKISSYIKLASSANPKGREGQLIIMRSLQVIGEYLKNTLESPKLSSSTSEILLLSLPSNTRNVFISLRNSPSHVYSVTKRLEIEKTYNIDNFMSIQNDIKKISSITTYILYKNKIKILKALLKKMIDTEDTDELIKITLLFNKFKLDSVIKDNFNMIECTVLKTHIKGLKENWENVIEKTDYEAQIFKEMKKMVACENNKFNNIPIDFFSSASMLCNLYISLNDNKTDSSDIKLAKFYAERFLENMTSTIKPHCLQDIGELSVELFRIYVGKTKCDNRNEMYRLTRQIINIVNFETNNIKWLEQLKEKLNKITFSVKETNIYSISVEESNIYSISDEKCTNALTYKLFELQNILSSSVLNNNMKITTENIDENLQAILEILILDILSILGSFENYLENNLLFLDENTPLMIGKCLRNHLEYDNTLIDILLSDPSITVILNAKKLIMENLITNKKRIGKPVTEDPIKLNNRCDQGLVTIIGQKNMFAALEDGNLECLTSNIAKGADINGRNINLQTALHFAAKGRNLEIVRFLDDHNLNINGKDIDGQTPLHVAAAYGSTSIVQFFIKEKGLYINDKDNEGRTPLHHAAQNGHKETVKVLLKHKADIIKDQLGYLPLHYAIRNNHKDVFVTLISELETEVDNIEAIGGFTPLHLAADKGHVDIVKYLLKLKANIFAKTDRGATPLHLAVMKCHLEVVNVLISNGSNIHSKNIGGSTPLHHAAEFGYEQIANVLLEHGADANAFDNVRNTPLHYAAKDGYDKIVNILLNIGANAFYTNTTGETPFHLAIINGHLKTVNTLLKHESYIIVKHKNFLNLAIEYGHKDIAELLINHNADVNVQCTSNYTPIHMAALNGNKDIVNLLINKNVNVNVNDINGFTPLHVAVDNNVTEIVNILLQNKADVNVFTKNGTTPMHLAAEKGNTDIIDLLIKNNGKVNSTNTAGLKPLHLAAKYNHKDAIIFLIKNKAEINANDLNGKTALHMAVIFESQEALEALIANKADLNTNYINDDSIIRTPLISAIECNNKKIVEMLIVNGADINAIGGKPLACAIISRNKDIVEIFIRNNARIDTTKVDGVIMPVLHLAVAKNLKSIVDILIKKGIDVNCTTSKKETALHFAAKLGHEDIVKMLIENGASVNSKNQDGLTSLQLAVREGHTNIVGILLQSVTDASIKGDEDILLRTAAQAAPNLGIIRLLIDKGADMNAKDSSGAKPIHIAATKDHKDTVEFFITRGQSYNESGANNRVLLHYAALSGQLKVAEYLVEHGADVNAQDGKGTAPIHLAATHGYKEVVTFLLEKGAFYNVADENSQMPFEMCTNEDLKKSLIETEKLLKSVQLDNAADVQKCIEEGGAFINAKNTDNVTALHHAAGEGYEDIVNILLNNNGNPNVTDENGLTPLHYAVKFSRLKITKVLLANGAMYDALSETGEAPLDIANEKNIINLLKIIAGSFQSIKNGTDRFINELKKIKNIDTAKAIMGAVNRESETLIVHAIHYNFANVEQLKQLWQDDASDQLQTAALYFEREQYDDALSIYTKVLNKRIEIFGANNASTLDIQYKMTAVLYKQCKYPEGLNLLMEIYEKQSNISVLGPDAKDTLATRSRIALTLTTQGRSHEALKILEETYKKQKEIPDIAESDILNTRFYIGLVLAGMHNFYDAMKIFVEVFEIQKATLSEHHPQTLETEYQIVELLNRQGTVAESMQMYNHRISSLRHTDTKESSSNRADTSQDYCPTSSNICHVRKLAHSIIEALRKQRQISKALVLFQEFYNIERAVLGPAHEFCMYDLPHLAKMYVDKGNLDTAVEYFRVYRELKADQLGRGHAEVEGIDKALQVIKQQIRQKDLILKAAIECDDERAVRCLLTNRTDVNDQVSDGRTLLHYAVDRGNVEIVKMLLESGAIVAKATDKGNTALHTASSRDYSEIVEVLLEHASRGKLANELVNAKTSGRGTTALHVAAKGGYFAIAKSLLKHGAVYDVKNNDDEMPLDVSKDQSVGNLLRLIEELFVDAQKGSDKILDKLKVVSAEEFSAITNTRNHQGKTLIQVAIMNKHQQLAGRLLTMLKGATGS